MINSLDRRQVMAQRAVLALCCWAIWLAGRESGQRATIGVLRRTYLEGLHKGAGTRAT